MGYQPSTAEGPDGALADAAGLSRLAAEILESSGEKWLRGYVEIERGLIAEAMGDSTGAAQHFRTACELRRALGDPQGTASALIYLADVLLDDQHIEETTAIHAEASALFERVGDASGVAEAERLAGRIALVRGDFEAARAHFTRTIEQSMAIGFTNNALSALRGLGKVLEKTGRLQPAATVHAFVASQPAGTPFSRLCLRDRRDGRPACSDDVHGQAAAPNPCPVN
jgi:tetratricopeptide (TPR) repeat protein